MIVSDCASHEVIRHILGWKGDRLDREITVTVNSSVPERTLSVYPWIRCIDPMGELETEEQTSHAEIATPLRDLADQLDGGGEGVFEFSGAAVLVNPSEPVPFKREGESARFDRDTEAKQRIEFELVWWPKADTAKGGGRYP